jgi:thiol-disulfide isomerase/thioredoxin
LRRAFEPDIGSGCTEDSVERVTDPAGLAAAVERGKTAVLLHATWCPFCRAFRPVFARTVAEAGGGWTPVEAILDEDANPLWSACAVEVVPTVLLYEDGRPAGRLDGRAGVGITAGELAAALARP